MEDFLSNHWNLYGLQVLACILIFIITYQYLNWRALFAVSVCLYIIGITQRILGVRWGLVLAQLEKDRIGRVIDELKKREKRKK